MPHKLHQEIIIDAGSLTGDISFRQNTKACRTAMAFDFAVFNRKLLGHKLCTSDLFNYLPPLVRCICGLRLLPQSDCTDGLSNKIDDFSLLLQVLVW